MEPNGVHECLVAWGKEDCLFWEIKLKILGSDWPSNEALQCVWNDHGD